MAAKKLKILYVLDILRELTDEEHRLSVPEIGEELARRGVDAERKSIYRDLDALIEYGFDIKKTASGYYMGSREFELWELKLLASAVSAATFVSESRSRALIKKLSRLSGKYAGAALETSSISGVKCKNDEVYRAIELVNAAIAERRQITFAYYKRDVSKRLVAQRGGERYRVSPYAMVWVQDRYYLVCSVHGHDALTHFRLDRIRGARIDPQPARPFQEVSEYTGAFDISDYAKKCVNMYGGTPERISLRCSARLADEILDRFGEDTPLMKSGLGFVCTVTAAANEGFMGWAAQYGDLVEILSPESLRAGMKEYLERALKSY